MEFEDDSLVNRLEAYLANKKILWLRFYLGIIFHHFSNE